jgi:hypothetical protein
MTDQLGSAPAGNPPATPLTPSPAAQDWTATFDDSTRGVIQTKGWKTPADVIGSYTNLEKLLGADKAGRAIVPPKDDAAPEDWQAFYNKLGRPESADGYKLPVPEGDTGDFAKTASNWFHEAGLNTKQAEAIAGKWNEFQSSLVEQQHEELAQKAEIDIQDLKKTWGDKYEANAELAKRAIREAGLSSEEGQAIERALGVKKAAEVFATLGKQFAEAPMKGGEGDVGGRFGFTPADAKAKISQLQKDTGWTAKYLSGDVTARQEFDRLHKIAYPDV